MTWLLVEDDPDIRTVVAVMMQLWGETALALPDGNAAWKWLDTVEGGAAHDLPELALMDIRMPGHTGDQIAARIRQTEKLKHIPIILMTAFSLTDAEVSTMKEKAGIDHLIKKPLPDMDDFKSTLYRVRDEKRKNLAAAPATPPASPPVVSAPPPVPNGQATVSSAPAVPSPAPATPAPAAPSVTTPPTTPTPVQAAPAPITPAPIVPPAAPTTAVASPVPPAAPSIITTVQAAPVTPASPQQPAPSQPVAPATPASSAPKPNRDTKPLG